MIHVGEKTSEFPTRTYFVMNRVQHIAYITLLQWLVIKAKL
jgi:hypothetical protein